METKYDKGGKEYAVNRELRFVDSFKFMASSLSSLLKNVKEFPHLSHIYQGEQLELLLKKGVYPYEWVDLPERFNETQLSPKEAFRSKLIGEDITDEGYEHAQKIWKAFGCKTFRTSHNLYNMADVFQLADIFESFRDVCIKNYKLDPLWNYTASGLAWDACLKLTGISIELPKEIDMVLLLKS
jgi:hypothetical protein